MSVGLGLTLMFAWAAGASGHAAAAPPPAGGSGAVTGVPGTAVPAPAAGVRQIGVAPSGATVTTHVFLAGRSAALATFAASVSTPGSGDYQHFLSPAQVQARFGATAAQATAVERWLRGAGLRVTRVDPREITATGTTAQTDVAYGTKLGRYEGRNGGFTAPSRPASVPAGVSRAVLSVVGLDSRPGLMHPGALGTETGPASRYGQRAAVPMSTGADGATYIGPTPCSSYYGELTDTTDPEFEGAQQPYTTCGYVPAQLRSAYGLPGGSDGHGVTVAIVDAYANPTLEADANAYATTHGDPGFAPGQFTDTTDPATWRSEDLCGGTAGWAAEQALDIEAVHAMAPGADVAYFGANSCEDADFIATFSEIIDNHLADVISDSWGGVVYWAGTTESQAVIDEYTQLFETAAAEGIEVTFSTGDCGDSDPGTGCGASLQSTRPQPDFPASDPWVTAVGGTAVAIGQSGAVDRVVPWGNDAWLLGSGGWSPYGWLAGGGGGTSYTFAQPSYQEGVVPTSLAETEQNGSTSATPMRVVPDLSLDADPYTGMLIGQTQSLPTGGVGYAESDSGGTSLASPLFAGLVADGISRGALARGFLNPTLYSVYGQGGARFYDDVTDPTATDTPAEILPGEPAAREPAAAITLGDDRALTATVGYDDATGLGMPTTGFLSLGDTTTTLFASADPTALGAALGFTATVAPAAEPGTPTGSAQFYIDGTPSGSPVTLSGGTAQSAPVADLGGGTHTVTAAYGGDSAQGFLPSTSAGLSHTVTPAATRLSGLTLQGIDPLAHDGRVSVTLTRTDTGATLAGQTVTFTAGGAALCAATTAAGGVASCQFPLAGALGSLVAAGYTATFTGTADYLAATATAGLPPGFVVPSTTPPCPTARGRLAKLWLGPIRLGMTRARARRALPTFTAGPRRFDHFCLAGGEISVAYPSHRLLAALPARDRRRLRGRVAMALTANPHYALDGIRPGTPLRRAKPKLELGRGIRIGKRTWYVKPERRDAAVLVAGNGVVRDVGIANLVVTATRHTQRRLLNGF